MLMNQAYSPQSFYVFFTIAMPEKIKKNRLCVSNCIVEHGVFFAVQACKNILS